MHPAGFDAATAYATLVYVSTSAPEFLKTARAFLETCQTRNYATAFEHILLIRWLSRDAFQLRQDYGRFWAFLRNTVSDLPAVLPNIWLI
jgi:uncharacterized membrane protein